MRKVRTGSVVRVAMDRTAVVEMVWKQRNRLYRKQVRRLTRFVVHDPDSQCQLGDVVRIQETRPISKTKHWRLLEILTRRQVADIRPTELEADAEAYVVEEEPTDIQEGSLDQMDDDQAGEDQTSEDQTDEAQTDEDEATVDQAHQDEVTGEDTTSEQQETEQ